MRIRNKVNVKVADDVTENDVLFGPADEKAEVTIDAYSEESSGKFVIAASGSYVIPLGSVSAVRGLYVRATGDFDITLNGAAAPLQIRRPANSSSTFPGKIYLDGVVTSATVINASATALLNGYFILWGD